MLDSVSACVVKNVHLQNGILCLHALVLLFLDDQACTSGYFCPRMMHCIDAQISERGSSMTWPSSKRDMQDALLSASSYLYWSPKIQPRHICRSNLCNLKAAFGSGLVCVSHCCFCWSSFVRCIGSRNVLFSKSSEWNRWGGQFSWIFFPTNVEYHCLTTTNNDKPNTLNSCLETFKTRQTTIWISRVTFQVSKSKSDGGYQVSRTSRNPVLRIHRGGPWIPASDSNKRLPLSCLPWQICQ